MCGCGGVGVGVAWNFHCLYKLTLKKWTKCVLHASLFSRRVLATIVDLETSGASHVTVM